MIKYKATMTDEELVEKIVNQQIFSIKLQRRYRDHPLALPPPTRKERANQDAEWQEAIRRGLHEQINLIVQERQNKGARNENT